jgi:prepilin-type N-terminal cleavage/methylation domain-containing protein
MRNITTQQGLSLIELMIAITLGLTLMAAAMQFIVSTRQTYELNDDISRIQENGRIALDILTSDLRLAGYRKPFNGDGTVPNYFLNDCSITNNDTSPDILCLQDGGGTNSDRISVQFDPPPDDGSTETDCLGNEITTDSIIVNSYTIADEDEDGVNSLYCESYDASTGTVISSAQPLVDGIDNMQVLYGIADDETNINRYVSGDNLYDASDAPIEDDWQNIRAIRIALLVSNGSTEGFAEARIREYRLFDSDVITTDADDRQPRRIYSTTVQFNNHNIQ